MEEILDKLQKHSVVVVSSPTGSGKSTQYVLNLVSR